MGMHLIVVSHYKVISFLIEPVPYEKCAKAFALDTIQVIWRFVLADHLKIVDSFISTEFNFEMFLLRYFSCTYKELSDVLTKDIELLDSTRCRVGSDIRVE
jgi:hypothetical protein